MKEDKRLIDSWFVVFLPSLFLILYFTLQYFFNDLVEFLVLWLK
ncbi:hypothetical protein [Bacillus sp. AFS098217]|nr:hypothetical protein [Bacillus sp. AFS098217]